MKVSVQVLASARYLRLADIHEIGKHIVGKTEPPKRTLQCLEQGQNVGIGRKCQIKNIYLEMRTRMSGHW